MTQAGKSLTISASHPALDGHFPGQPVVPGVVWLAEVTDAAHSQLGFPAGPCCWQRVRFTRAVAPDEPVRLELSGDDQAFSFHLSTAQGETVASGKCRRGALE